MMKPVSLLGCLLVCSVVNLWGVFCPICEKSCCVFLPFNNRTNARCPNCLAVERHRLLWIFLNENKNILNKNSIRLLHFAPEHCFYKKFCLMENVEYIPADLHPARYRYKEHKVKCLEMDITDIKLPNDSVDVIICSHVLEHVVEDRRAMKELFRVLRQGGIALIMIPFFKELDKTYEDSNITSPEDRLKFFGQRDHVRKYGNDFIDRLKSAGFTVQIYSSLKFSKEKRRFLSMAGEIFCCTKSLK